MFAIFGPGHWAVLAVVLIVLLGAKKLPDSARSLAKSMRIFKAECRSLQPPTELLPLGNRRAHGVNGSAPSARGFCVRPCSGDLRTPLGRIA